MSGKTLALFGPEYLFSFLWTLLGMAALSLLIRAAFFSADTVASILLVHQQRRLIQLRRGPSAVPFRSVL